MVGIRGLNAFKDKLYHPVSLVDLEFSVGVINHYCFDKTAVVTAYNSNTIIKAFTDRQDQGAILA